MNLTVERITKKITRSSPCTHKTDGKREISATVWYEKCSLWLFDHFRNL